MSVDKVLCTKMASTAFFHPPSKLSSHDRDVKIMFNI